jgi:uracil-DNA glycosylase
MESQVKINVTDKEYDWKEMSLWEFLEEGNIPSGWTEFFEKEKVQQQLWSVSEDLNDTRQSKTIFPPIHQVFRAFYTVPLDKIKAVIIGMDPYHNGSAVGLCFSVKPGNRINPSLRNIYKELKLESFQPVENGNLTHWARQILMLNMALTVEKSNPGSHSCIWHPFSKLLVRYISEKRGDDIHWLLFGKDAHTVTKLVTKGRFHCVSHPSPLAAYRRCGEYPAFIGSGVFKHIPNMEW